MIDKEGVTVCCILIIAFFSFSRPKQCTPTLLLLFHVHIHVIYIIIYVGEEAYMVNIQPETNDQGRGVYVHHDTASST